MRPTPPASPPTRTAGVRGLGRWVLALAVLAIAGAVGWGTPAAQAQTTTSGSEQITRFDSDVVVDREGTATVTERILYDFGYAPHHGILRSIPVRFGYDDVKKGYDRVTPLDVKRVAASAGTSADYERSTEGGDVVLKIGDPDKTVTGQHLYEITYTLRGALNHFEDHDELYLNITGNGWDVPIEKTTATIKVPGAVGKVACFAGPAGSSLPCDSAAKQEGKAVFSQGPMPVGSGLTTVVGFPTGSVVPTPTPILDQRWSVTNAFALRPNTVGPAGVLAVLLVGGFVFLLTKAGRDERYAGSATDVAFGNATGVTQKAPLRDDDPIPVEFVPPDGLRPGQVGTLIDEQANTLDVTATIIDLAARGFVRITEIPKQGWLGSPDWQLDSVKPGTGLMPYESALLTAVFASGPSVRLSSLKNQFATHLKACEDQLYDDLVAQGWYRRRPDHTRARAGCLAVVVIILGIGATIALAASTSFGLLGIPLVVFGLLLIFANRVFPARTAKGYATVRRVKGFKQFIDESEKDRARFAEQQHLFSEYLPYAVVFGAVDKWARAFAGIDGQLPQTDWYVSQHAFNAVMFSQAMGSFTTTTAGTISSVPASSGSSGFSGGSSGGGFGGGGGGSW